MWMATTEDQFAPHLPDTHPKTPVAPGVFSRPLDVIAADDLSAARKREILAAWASDASAVQDRPTLRWLLGTPAPVPLEDVLKALHSLDADCDVRRQADAIDAPLAFVEPVRIRVEPCGDGWAVRCAGLANEQLFRSGRTAERVARRLGERLAAAGRWAEIQVRLRNGGLAGRFVCAPA